MYFYHNSLNVLRLTFLNIYMKFFRAARIVGKLGSKLDKKIFFYLQELLHQEICNFHFFFPLKCTFPDPNKREPVK